MLSISAACLAAVRIPHGQTAWIVVSPASDLERRTLAQLARYVKAVVDSEPKVAAQLSDVPRGTAALALLHAQESSPLPCQPPAGSPEAFCIAGGTVDARPVIVLKGAGDRGLKRAVQRLVMASRQADGGLEFPDAPVAEKPWIPEREWALNPGVPQHVRGVFVNPFADNRLDIWLFGDKQLANYVDMFDWFGFSGVQLIESSYSYGVQGSPEAFHRPELRIAEDARQAGQNVTLWVWAAEFNS